MCFYNDGETATLCGNKIRKARKAHRCDNCGKAIERGSQYQVSSGLWDGGFFETKICNLCYQDTIAIVAHELAEGCRWHEAWPSDRDDIDEWFRDHPQSKRAVEPVDLVALCDRLGK